jgi:hypothetical protein
MLAPTSSAEKRYFSASDVEEKLEAGCKIPKKAIHL